MAETSGSIEPTELRSGLVGVVGRPNVGKSTLVNHLVGAKVAIVSPRPQTTRYRILGVVHRPGVQLALVDTPGLHKPEHALGRSMVELAKSVFDEADALLVMIDGRVGITDEDQRVFDRVKHSKRPIILAINKIDTVKKPKLLPVLEACSKTGLFKECIPISALMGVQTDVLVERLITYLPIGPQWYEPGQQTDQSEPRRVAELIREQILLATHEEVPHAVAVLIEDYEQRDKLLAIRATILVERQGQKAIVIGRGGEMLKEVGSQARRQIEQLVGRKVHLELWVKVEPGWRQDPHMLERLGYLGG